MPADEGPAQKMQRKSVNSPATIGDIVDFTTVHMLDQGGDNDQQLFERQQSVSDCVIHVHACMGVYISDVCVHM